MKTTWKLRIMSLSIFLITLLAVQQDVQAQPGVRISFQTFYNELSPYGRWSQSPQYGSIWIPYADQGFQPYSTNGYWEVTEYGNTWVSDYDWGWAPFHYGRWGYDDYAGWFWIPGYEWGPAWVNWRSGGDYYGWAPLGPGMNINISVNIPSFWWVFVPQRYITQRYWSNYCVPRARLDRVYRSTTIINNYYRVDNRSYVYGPRRDEIERVTRRSVPVRQIDVSQRGRVMVDRSNGRSNADYGPDRSRPSYNNRGGYESNNRGGYGANNRGSYESNDRGRVNAGSSRPDYNDNNRGRSSERAGTPERSTPTPDYNNRRTPEYSQPSQPNRDGYERPERNSNENARPSAPVERSTPSYDNRGRSGRSDAGVQGSERSSGGRQGGGNERSSQGSSERSSQGNNSGGEQSGGRGGRGPR